MNLIFSLVGVAMAAAFGYLVSYSLHRAAEDRYTQAQLKDYLPENAESVVSVWMDRSVCGAVLVQTFIGVVTTAASGQVGIAFWVYLVGLTFSVLVLIYLFILVGSEGEKTYGRRQGRVALSVPAGIALLLSIFAIVFSQTA